MVEETSCVCAKVLVISFTLLLVDDMKVHTHFMFTHKGCIFCTSNEYSMRNGKHLGAV
jgi:hypothetical protein